MSHELRMVGGPGAAPALLQRIVATTCLREGRRPLPENAANYQITRGVRESGCGKDILQKARTRISQTIGNRANNPRRKNANIERLGSGDTSPDKEQHMLDSIR